MNDKEPPLGATRTFAAPDQAPLPAASPPSLPVRIGRYKVERLLGQGGFGLVFLARDEQLDRLVAVKVPHPRLVSRPEDAQAYLTEARTVANLDQPHIVPVHDVGSTDEFPCYVVSKYIEGADLSATLKQSRLSSAQAADLVATVAEALHYAHKQGLVHRDVKPGNILLDKSGRPFVVDFGLALREQDLSTGPKYAGTPAYMSPEQARGEGHRVDGRSDIFSLGVVFYELLVGRRPFTAHSREELREQVTTHEPRPPRQYDDDIPKELERICLKALAKRAADRHTTAFDLADDLRHWLSGQAVKEQSEVGAKGTRSAAITPVAPPPSTSVASGPSTPGTPISDSQPIKIVPKGLRSFDEHDADFFLELVPGPRGREGLPDSLRFWKTKIEEPDTDKTFSVGLIYGPSGCGKSSLVKAGLVPRLSEHVIVVYLEATAGETELRLLNGLRKRCPALPDNLSLKETLAMLRRGQGIPAVKKVLIVLDQFEQWLHAKKEEQNAELVQALRQCDGVHLQCVVMVRDDFWLAVSRFMTALEIELLQGKNMALVDLFDLDHARKVLAAFGRAFGKLPDSSSETHSEQKYFLNQAIHGLTQEGKVISVRLALFAEMMKGKPWTPASLKEVGGTEGVGVTFLEETFAASTAPPQHRVHQKAAQAILRALLPEIGTDIKGNMCSEQELVADSGYAAQSNNFGTLMRILDGELRLITPTEREEAASVSKGDHRSYQLTHDYLVPSLRDWLTRKQRETRRGRAELRLVERSAAWNTKPDTRFLPSWWEWPNILLFTQRGKWTTPERRVMRAARKHHGLRLTGILTIITIAAFTAFEASRRIEMRRANDLAAAEQARAETFAENVFTARAEGVPYALDNLQPLGHLAISFLRERLDDEKGDPVRRLHAAYALADNGQAPCEYLTDAVPTAPAGECRNLVAALEHAKMLALPELAQREAKATDTTAKARYAIVALHLGDPQPALDALTVRSDPIHRTTLIHSYAGWHGDPSVAVELLRASDAGAFRSGLCAAFGTIAPESLEPAERDQAVKALLALYTDAPDGGTHAAAGWALRQWKQEPPAIVPASRPPSDRRWFVNGQGMVMVEVAPGKFTMGTPGEVIQTEGEKPVHEVTLTKPFYLCDRELTVEQFQRFIDDAKYPAAEKPQDWHGKQFSATPDCPVQQVNWFDAVLYCNWLSTREGRKLCYERTGEKEKLKDNQNNEQEHDVWRCNFGADGYRLPTEAEWEYVSRAGSAEAFCYGSDDDLLSQYAWFVVNSKSRTWPGGMKIPSAVGLFDTHGNLWEWCWDWFGSYSADPATDPTGAVSQAAGSGRVLRGGAFNDYASPCRSASRGVSHPMSRNHYGFRVLCGR